MRSGVEWRSWAFRALRLRKEIPQLPKDSAESAESRFYQLVLARALSSEVRSACTQWIDVGCRNWSYLPGVLTSLPALRRGLGVELDPGRLYWNGFYRGDYAQAAALAGSTASRQIHFLPGDFTELPLTDCLKEPPALNSRPRLLITHFFPFVSTAPCRQWGLPARYADFRPLVHRTQELARAFPQAECHWLSLHQGDWEADLARPLWKQITCKIQEGRIDPPDFRGLWPGKYPVFWMTGDLAP